MITRAEIEAAARRLSPFVRRTPLDPSPSLSAAAGTEVALKMESWQQGGTVETRLAMNQLLALDEATRKRGVVAAGADGYVVGVAVAAKLLTLAAELFVPQSIDAAKLRVVAAHLRAGLQRADDLAAAEAAARAFADAHQRRLVTPGDDAALAAAGALGLEIAADAPDVALVVVGDVAPAIADGIAAALPAVEVWRAHDVDEDARADAVRRLYAEHRVIVEPGAAAAVALVTSRDVRRYRRVVALLSGRNLARDRFAAIIRAGRAGRGGRAQSPSP